jgi:hypothetical protein
MRVVAHHFRLRAWRAIAGAFFGAGLSSLANAAPPAVLSFGPRAIELFGYPVPIMSALFGLIGLVLARRVAPVTPAAVQLGRLGNIALTALLALGVLALIVADEKRPMVALGWAVGLGYSGLGFIELVARSVRNFARLAIQSFVRGGLQSLEAVAEPVTEEKS